MSASSDYLHVLTEVTRDKGATAAATARANSAIWGNSVAKLGDFASDAVKQYGIDKKAKKLEKEDQALRDLFTSAHQEWEQGQTATLPNLGTQPPSYTPGDLSGNTRVQSPTFGAGGPPQPFNAGGGAPQQPADTFMGPQQPAKPSRQMPYPSPAEIIKTVGPQRGIPIINALAALKTDPQGDPQKSLTMLQSVAKGLHALPEDMRAQAYPAIVQDFEQRGIVKPGMLQKDYSPDYWKFIMGTGQNPKEQNLVLVPGPEGKPVYGTPVEGQPAYEKPAADGRLVPVPGPDGKPVYGTPIAGAPVYEKPGSEGGGLWVSRNGKVIRVRENEVLPTDQRPPEQISGNAGMEQSNARKVAQGIRDGTMSPEILLSTRATAQGMALNAELKDLGVNTDKLTREWMGTKTAIRSLNGAQQIRLAEVINKASESLDKVEELNKQWTQNASRWGAKALNRASLRLAQNGAYGPEAASVAQRLDAQIADVTSELAQSIMGGNSPTDHAFELAKKNLSADWTQEVLSDAIKQARYNLNLAQNARNEILQQVGVTSTQVQTPPPANTAPATTTPKVNPFR